VITRGLIHTFRPKCDPRGGRQGSGDFCNEVPEYRFRVRHERALIRHRVLVRRVQADLSLSLSLSLCLFPIGLERQAEKIVRSAKFAKSNFNSRATTEIRFDIRQG